MASWILVPCLVSLRNEFNKLAPSRDKASDGAVGDTSHAAGASDHNPDETGNTPTKDVDDINEVHAIDVDTDLKKPGWNMQRCVDIIVENHRTGRDNRLQNVIYKRRIASASWGWTWRDYSGPSPHDEHAHFSARYITKNEQDTSPWGLLDADTAAATSQQKEDDMTTKSEFVTWLKDPEVRAALCTAVFSTDNVIPAPGAPKPGTGADGKPVNTHWAAASYLQSDYAASVAARTYAAAASAGVAKLGGKDFVDEADIIAGVIAGVQPGIIAAAIPQEMVRQVLDALGARISNG